MILNPLITLRATLHEIRNWWLNQRPAHKWMLISDFGRMICETIGIRNFSDMKNYWYTASGGVCLLIYTILDVYTIYYHWRRNEIIKIAECSYLIGYSIGVRCAIEVLFGLP